MIDRLIVSILYTAELQAWAMINAGERAVFAPTNLAARVWEAVGRAGETVEATVDHLATKAGVDLGSYMSMRAEHA